MNERGCSSRFVSSSASSINASVDGAYDLDLCFAFGYGVLSIMDQFPDVTGIIRDEMGQESQFDYFTKALLACDDIVIGKWDGNQSLRCFAWGFCLAVCLDCFLSHWFIRYLILSIETTESA